MRDVLRQSHREFRVGIMSFDVTLTKTDFDEAQWQSAITPAEKRECATYRSLFRAKANEAKSAENRQAEAVFLLLEAVTSLDFQLDSKEMPLQPIFRGPTVDDICNEYSSVLTELCSEISDPEMRARIADVLWLGNRDYKMAQLAVNAYLESARELEHPQHWPPYTKRVERSLQLAVSLKHQELANSVLAHIEEVLQKHNAEDPLFLSTTLMEILQQYRKGNPSKYAALAERAAILAETSGNWRKAKMCWEIKAKWHAIDEDVDEERKALIHAAETCVKEAESRVPEYLVTSRIYAEAIEAFRRIGGMQTRVEQLHKILLEHEKLAEANMKEVSIGPIDVSEPVRKAKEEVSGKTLYDALFALALMGTPPKLTDLRDQVDRYLNEFPIQYLASRTTVNEVGKVVARWPDVFSNDSEEQAQAISAEMWREAINWQEVRAISTIEPARHQINLEHRVRINDLLPIVSNNPFVPPNHELIYARGLHAGLTGDFLVAAHLLILQWESSIRYLLAQRGVITSKLSQGVQDEYSITSLLPRPEVEEIFGADLVFDLRGLLIERHGSNLRNLLAHGLLDQNSFFSGRVLYLWWLTLRICCWPIIMHLSDKESAAGETGTEEE